MQLFKTDSIARRILGWKLNSWDRWYDYEMGTFIHETDFQPEHNLDHAMLIVERLKKFGFSFSSDGVSEASFNDIRGTGDTLSQAITNAAYTIIEKNSVVESTRLWNQLC